MLFCNPRKLKRNGVLAMNKRNIDYIGRYNARKHYKLVDDKLSTKQIALDGNIAAPALIGVIRRQHDIDEIPAMVTGHTGFAIKPAKGSGGKGILVVTKIQDGRYYKASGNEVTRKEIKRHASNILNGLYSLGGIPDVVIIEALIRFDPVFDGYSHEGIPDIRLIVFKGYPVMGMLRLSTHSSDGKANLHQGAVGVGLDIATGRGLHAVQHDTPTVDHPDTGKPLRHIQVPQWERFLSIAASTYEICHLGYLGADMVLDKEEGPLLLELNARPGLSIQIANNQGLLPRLRHIESLKGPRRPVDERVAYAREHFAAKVQFTDASESG